MACIKTIAESPGLNSIPPCYVFNNDPHDQILGSGPEKPIPTIDFSLLTSSSPHQRSKVIQELGRACQEWGFFMVINHGVPESLMEAMIDACRGFFDLTEEEKREFEGKHVLDPIRCGTSFNSSVEKVFFWRDFLKVLVHPQFHSPTKPVGFMYFLLTQHNTLHFLVNIHQEQNKGEVSLEFSKRIREVAMELLKGISESLGLEPCYIDKALNLDSGLQVLVANLYPPCPQPELAMGMPPHSDHGLLTLLTTNGIGGLQVQHDGKWVNISDTPPNSFLVNTADHLEILSNGRYKSVLHRVLVNNKATRISTGIAHGPSLDAVVSPAPELADGESNPPAYIGMTYKEYLVLQQSNKLDAKSCLDRVRV